MRSLRDRTHITRPEWGATFLLSRGRSCSAAKVAAA